MLIAHIMYLYYVAYYRLAFTIHCSHGADLIYLVRKFVDHNHELSDLFWIYFDSLERGKNQCILSCDVSIIIIQKMKNNLK